MCLCTLRPVFRCSTFLVIGNQLLFHGDAHPTNAEEARRRLQADEPRTVHLRSPKWAALLASLPADGDTTHTMEDMRRLAAPTLRSSSQAAALAQVRPQTSSAAIRSHHYALCARSSGTL